MGTLQMETSGMDTVEETSPGFSKFSICMHVWWDLGVGSNFIGSISYQNQPVKKKSCCKKHLPLALRELYSLKLIIGLQQNV